MVPVSVPSPHGYPIAYQMQPAYSAPMGYDYPFPPADYMQQQQQPNYVPFGTNAQHSSITKPRQELEIHEYSPREPVDPSVLPPKAKFGSQPKNYIFTNQGPEHFSSASP